MTLRSEATRERLTQEAPEDEGHTDCNVQAVEAGNHKEARSIDTAGIEPEAFMVEMRPFVALDSYEERTQKDGDEKPGEAGFSFVYSHLGKVKRKAARDEEYCVNRGQEHREMSNILAWRPSVARLPRETIFRQTENDVCTEKSREEHSFGEKKHDHTKFTGRWRCAVVFLRVVR